MRKKPSSFDRTPGRDKNFKRDSGKGAQGERPYKASGDKKFDGPKRSFGKSDDNERPKRSFNKDDRSERSFDKPKRSFDRSESRDTDRPKRSFNKDDRDDKSYDKPKRSFDRSESRDSDKPKRSFNRDDRGERSFDKPKRSFGKPGDNERPKRSFDRSESRDSDRPKRSFNKDDRSEKSFDKPKRSFDRSESRDSDRPKRSFNKDDRGERSFDKPKRSFDRSESRDSERPKRSFNKDDRGERSFDKPKRSFDKSDDRNSDRQKRSFDKESRGERSYDRPKRSFDKSESNDSDRPKRSFDKEGAGEKKEFGKKSFTIKKNDDFDKAYPLGSRKVSGPFRKKFQEEQAAKSDEFPKPERKRRRREEEEETEVEKDMTLNKYVAHSGECSRREAAALVKQGKVKVNGELMLDPGYRVKDTDHVSIAGKKLKPRRDFVYILLNKPKDFITTTEDPEGRKTVMDLVDNAGIDRLYPVGRLDRNTTGLLLMTNDGDLAQKLSHPSYEIKKVYQATLDKPLTKAHFEQIVNGLELEDGEVHVDALAYLDEKNELGLEIHNGRNRIVRRIFESLGYEVEKLDRVMYAGLTKKNLPRGKWRFLEDKEIIMLKHFKS